MRGGGSLIRPAATPIPGATLGQEVAAYLCSLLLRVSGRARGSCRVRLFCGRVFRHVGADLLRGFGPHPATPRNPLVEIAPLPGQAAKRADRNASPAGVFLKFVFKYVNVCHSPTIMRRFALFKCEYSHSPTIAMSLVANSRHK